jgi:CRP/FNR family transcriptional regulator, anaerobic regulatory protein
MHVVTNTISPIDPADLMMHRLAISNSNSNWSAREASLHFLCDYIEALTGLRIEQDEIPLLHQVLRFKTFRRRQYLLQEGDICRYIYFVIRGALRMYAVNERGQEAILAFGLENSWIADRESMSLQIPSLYNIEAVENTEVIQLTMGQLEMLSQTIPAVAEMIRLQNKQLAIITQKRIHAAISMTAEERYRDLLICHPEYAQRFSLTMIASYLGIKLETLSRVRKR